MSASPLVRPVVISLALFAACLAAGLYVVHLELEGWRRSNDARTEATAYKYAAAVERHLDRALLVAESMETFIRRHDGELYDFDAHSADMLRNIPIVSAVELAPGGVVRHIFPASSNAAFLGTQVTLPAGYRPQATSTTKLFLDGPHDTVHGPVVIGRYPVFLAHAAGGEGPFWGFASVYVQLDALLSSAGLETLDGLGYRFALLAADGLPVAGSTRRPAALQAMNAPVRVPGGGWSLQVAPKTPPAFPAFAVYQLLLVLVTGGAAAYLVFRLAWQPQQLRDEVAAASHALSLANARYQTVFSAIREVVFQVDADGRLKLLNPAWKQLSGFEVDASLGQPLLDYLHPDDLDRGRELFREAADHPGETSTLELRLRARDNVVKWIEFELRVNHDANGRLLGHAGSMRDITERKNADRLVHYQAHFDTLTNLPNRKLFLDRFGRAIEQARRNGRILALMFIDLDRFKWVNDYHGHAAGDDLLKETARRLNGCVRKADTVARFGGDEFVVLLVDINGALDAEIVARKILDALAMPFDVKGHKEVLSGSVGITLCPDDGVEPEVLLNNADNVMYHAKQAGRNTFRFFTSDINAALQARHRMAAELRQAIDGDGLGLEYQPIIALDEHCTVGIEALLRWRAPSFGAVPPGEVIALAEDTRLIERLGDWIIARACRDFIALRATLPDLEYVSVNISDRQFRLHGMRQLPELLTRFGLTPHELCIDITETLVADHREEVWQGLDVLREAGICVMLDDFGTGVSSLSNLNRLQPSAVKVQTADFTGAVPETSAAAMLGSIIAMAHSMGIRVVAEGIESHHQAEMLKVLGCDYAQGYYFCPPCPVDKLPAALASPAGSALPALEAAD